MLLDAIVTRKKTVARKPIDGRDHLMSLLKGISWRIVGTLDTIMISYIVTGRITLALSIGSIEVFTKIALFYFHDRAWELIRRKKSVNKDDV
ncbi:DUF2061 domain-containing protein [Compostibacter hankyongensis]|uniref:DUF2061 domain-containing protein n=1 Tax=Compostibacter hankyongensis TaxID=1007089 RepID=A0ABP8FWU3_9BACT